MPIPGNVDVERSIRLGYTVMHAADHAAPTEGSPKLPSPAEAAAAAATASATAAAAAAAAAAADSEAGASKSGDEAGAASGDSTYMSRVQALAETHEHARETVAKVSAVAAASVGSSGGGARCDEALKPYCTAAERKGLDAMTPRSRSATILATMLQKGGASNTAEGDGHGKEPDATLLPSALACPPPRSMPSETTASQSSSDASHVGATPELTPRTALSEAVKRIRKGGTHDDVAQSGVAAGARGVSLDTSDADRCRSPTRAYRV